MLSGSGHGVKNNRYRFDSDRAHIVRSNRGSFNGAEMDFKPDEEVVPHLPGQTLVYRGMRSSERRGNDTDIKTWDVIGADGKVVATYEVHNTVNIYPPQRRTQEVKKV